MIRYITFLFVLCLGFMAFEPKQAHASGSLTHNPLDNMRLTDTFRIRDVHPVSGRRNVPHWGVDYGGNRGDPIYTRHGGTISYSGAQRNSNGTVVGYGNYMTVTSHSGNYQTVYAHNQSNGFRDGATVSGGHQIATLGSSGGSTGPHLHHEVRVKGADGQFHRIDPQMAEGKNLDDPAVREQLIADSEAKMQGRDSATNSPEGGDGGEDGADSGGNDPNGRGGDVTDQAGCDPAIGNQMKQQAEAIRKQMTENANALITKPPSLMQLTCFDQYTKINSEGIGRIHSDPPQGISDTIAPNVEMPSMQNIMSNFTTGLGFGGILSSLTSSFQSYLGSLTGGLLGGGGAGGGCDMMNQMWEMMQCFDLPQMPSLQDIMGGAGGGGGIGQITSALGSLANGDIGGLMGAACEAIGGGGGGDNPYQDLLDSINDEADDEEENTCDYSLIVGVIQNRLANSEFIKIDEAGNNNGTVSADDFEAVDTNMSCTVSDEELEAIGVDLSISNRTDR